jgi:dienelactone hydrolase
MIPTFTHLGPFSDLVAAAQASRPVAPVATPGPATQGLVREVLGFSHGLEQPQDVRVERRWERGGVEGEEISWWVGYGPRTYAWLLKPAGAEGWLPAVVALHDHGGFKYFGKEKIADGPDETAPILTNFRAESYGGRAYANALAQAGFAVLVPDTFLWGSRRFPLDTIPAGARAIADTWRSWWFQTGWPQEDIVAYNAAASHHEDVVERYCAVLGTSLAGVVSYEDRVAANYLAGRSDVDPARLGCIGLSGGGCRAALLGATSPHMAATVIVGMMSTYAGLLDSHVESHTWMLFPHGWARHGDWTDLTACRAPMPLLVQYDLQDELFSEAGMRAADERLAAHYATVGHPRHYRGEFYPGMHKFDQEMQAAAFRWLIEQLRPAEDGPAPL